MRRRSSTPCKRAKKTVPTLSRKGLAVPHGRLDGIDSRSRYARCAEGVPQEATGERAELLFSSLPRPVSRASSRGSYRTLPV